MTSGTSFTAKCSENHCIQVLHDGTYVWGLNSSRGNRFGQLGRRPSSSRSTAARHDGDQLPYDDIKVPRKIPMECSTAAAGGSKDSGHTLLVDRKGQVWACGCDRWQQLGLGSTEAGAAGYTWKEGKLWQHDPQKVHALSHQVVVAVAAGADHSVALSDLGEVWTWGRGEHGQLGQQGRPFVMPPTKSVELSGSSGQRVKSILAEGNCTGALLVRKGDDGTTSTLLKSVGRCSNEILDMWRKTYDGKEDIEMTPKT